MTDAPAVKMVLLIKRKPGTTLEQFIDYYENKHAPFILSCSSKVSLYRRNYVQHSFLADYGEGKVPADDPDVVTEIHFSSQAQFDAFTAECNQHMDAIAADEAKFSDRTSIRGYLVMQKDSKLP